jgi:group II intron reverse transcriptase/maturase
MQPDAVRRRLASLPDLAVNGRPINGLYRLLASPVIWEMAYENIASNKGATTPGLTGQSLDGYSPQRVQSIIDRLMTGSYRFTPARRVRIPKRSGGSRPLGIPSGDDKLVQEAVRLILERIYEPVFSDHSHGFRRERSPHTALEAIRRTWTGVHWFVEADIKGCFDNLDHGILLSLLGRRVDDKPLLRLIRGMLEAGYVEQWTYHRTYSGSPQGGVISPLLANVYLHELDQFMHGQIAAYNRGDHRQVTAEWQQLRTEIDRHQRMLRRIADDPDQHAKASRLRETIASLRATRRTIPSRDPFDPRYRRLRYCRYADDFLVGVIGPRGEAAQSLEDVKRKLTNLKLQVAPEKTGIRRATDGVLFLGYEVRTYNGTYVRKAKLRGRTTTIAAPSGRVQLHVPPSRLREFAKARRYGDLDHLKAAHRPELANISDVEIVLAYNTELRGLANYYALALEVSPLDKLAFLWRSSLLATLARKHDSSVRKEYRRLRDGDSLRVRNPRNGKPASVTVWSLKNLKRSPTKWASIDVRPNTMMFTRARTEVTERLNAKVCEWCGRTDLPCEVHHVRKLVDHRDSPLWEQVRAARQRKRIVLCMDCHRAVHNGRLPDLRAMKR